MRRGKSYHLNSTCDIGEPDLPGPDRGKRGAMWREPLTGNMGEDLEPHKPVHETTTGSWTSKNGNEGGRPTSSLSLPASHGWCHLHFRERGSPMKNRKREICPSGCVRVEDGQPPHLLGRRTFLHLAAGAAALPAASLVARAQASASDRGLSRWRRSRHPRSTDGTMAIGAARPAIHHREPAGCRHQYRHRSGCARTRRWPYAPPGWSLERYQCDTL